jgi:type II secretory pathway pseudopilin PulG
MKFGLRRLHAFSLVELTLALGIAAFCMIAVFGLVPVGVQTNRNATSQTAATNILSSVVSDIRASPKGGVSPFLTAKYKIRRAKGGQTTVCFDGQGQPDGAGRIGNVSCLAGNWRYRLYIKIYPPTALPSNFIPYCANYAVLKLVWPAAADPLSTTVTPSGSVEMVTTFFDQ